MRILIEGWRLTRTRNHGGVESYWHQLVPALFDLVEEEDSEIQFTLLSAFLHPRHIKLFEKYRERGATLRHWWMSPNLLNQLGEWNTPAEWFGGEHDLLHGCETSLRIRGRGKLMLTCHDLMFHHAPQYLDPTWVGHLQRGFEAALPDCSFWMCSSEHTREDLITNFGVPRGRTKIAFPGANPVFFTAGEAKELGHAPMEIDDAPYLFVGSTEAKKNLPRLIEAFGCARERGLKGTLSIAGRVSWGAHELQDCLRRFPGIQEHINLLGFIPNSELKELVAGAKAMITPSLYEGFGMPVIEAMAAGTPVISSNATALASTCGDAAAMFHPESVEEITEQLLRVDEDKDLRMNMRAAGRLHAAPYTWQNCARATLNSYRRTMELPS